ncbi:tRNA-His guanylyltransferase [Rhizina undulata]
MANSKYEYVKLFERPDNLLPNAWIVVRIDGRGFHKFSARHGFTKPNDRRALDLMNAAAVEVVKELPDIVVAYGVSDEFSFVLHRSCGLFERRESKLVTTITSTFTSYYVYLWPQFFPNTKLSPPLPSFDGRAVLYPTNANLRDYMNWRQVDCHINNLYNTTFWALVQQGGLTSVQAEEELKGTYAADKNEILFKRFGINYNNEPEFFKKGSVVFRDYSTPDLPKPQNADGEKEKEPEEDEEKGTGQVPEKSKSQVIMEAKRIRKARVVVEHVDIIKDDFWNERPWILANRN